MNIRYNIETILLVITIVFLLFLQTNLHLILPIKITIYRLFFLVLVCFGYKFSQYNRDSNLIRSSLALIFIATFATLVKFSMGEDFHLQLIQCFIVPFLFAIILDASFEEHKVLVRNSVLLLYLSIVCISIYERYTYTIWLPIDEETYHSLNYSEDLWSFRASGLYGHPLFSSFALVTYMSFIASSNIKTILKLILLGLGFVGLLCYNERGHILIAAIAIPLILGFQYKNFSRKEKILTVIIGCTLFLFLIKMIENFEFGGRLLQNDIDIHDDASIMARIEALDVFSYFNTSDFLWGAKDLYSRAIIIMGLAGIENGFIAFVLLWGLVMGIPLLFVLITWQLQALQVYHGKIKYILFAVFHISAFFSPQITTYLPWFTFIIAYYAFCPQTQYCKVNANK